MKRNEAALRNGLTLHEQAAWEQYCWETRGTMDVKDHWSELSSKVQEHFLDKMSYAFPRGHQAKRIKILKESK